MQVERPVGRVESPVALLLAGKVDVTVATEALRNEQFLAVRAFNARLGRQRIVQLSWNLNRDYEKIKFTRRKICP